ncbi:MAG TPA: NAD(P)-dependent oxidoreductase [Candidatus Cybelea sp.]|nr:NAD(P)-dependent oxidoreductase [Candidatus Cybelea sp.]
MAGEGQPITPPARIGFVGVGNMGRPMARRLIEAGYKLALYDLDRAGLERFASEHGGTAVASLRAAADGAAAVITMLPNGKIVRQAVLGEDGGDCIAAGLAKGAVVVDMSSSAPTGTKALGAELERRGIGLIDAPVSGGVRRAVDGSLSIMAGGDAALIERCRPLLAPMGRQIFATGGLGSGHAMKALNNLCSAAGVWIAAEALLVGQRFGLDPAVMVDILNASTGRNNATDVKFKQQILNRSFAAGFTMGLMAKDLATMVELAHDTATPVPFAELCAKLWSDAAVQLGADADHTASVQYLERMAGEELGRPKSKRH